MTVAVTAAGPVRNSPDTANRIPPPPDPAGVTTAAADAGRPGVLIDPGLCWPPVACQGMGDWPFFDPDTERAVSRARRVAHAKAICASCAALLHCRVFALRTGQVSGIWGGLSEEERGQVIPVRVPPGRRTTPGVPGSSPAAVCRAMSVDAEPVPSRRERPGGNGYPPVMSTTVWNGGQKSTVVVRSVLIHDPRAAAREALTHAVTAAMTSVIHVTCVPDPADLSASFAGNPADLVLIGLQGSSAGSVDPADRFLQRHPSAPVIVFGAVDDTPVLAAAVARGARGLMLWSPWGGRTPVRGLSIGARPGVRSAPELTLIQRTVLQGMSQGRSNRDIAKALGVSEDAVKSHTVSLYRKLGARDRAHAVALGLRQRLVS